MDTKYIIALVIGLGIYASTMSALFKVYKPSIKAKKERQEKIKNERDKIVKARILVEEKDRLDNLNSSKDKKIIDKEIIEEDISSSPLEED